MNKEVSQLEPTTVWTNFEKLNEVPRGSKKEERVIAFMKKFGEDLGLETKVDATGNVYIAKPATPGMENRKGVVLQSHLDMVHQKNSDSNFDFDTMGIESYIDGDWVKAKGTTLGSDNGMGVAAIMTVLASRVIPHGPIEAFFTIDEETGMTGAFGLEGGLLKGDILLNLDSEDEGELYIGCAGGIDTSVRDTYTPVEVPGDHVALKVMVKGLKGGHSGMDIALERGNANKVLNRLLVDLNDMFEIGLAELEGGNLRNAIPREAFAVILFRSSTEKEITAFIGGFEKTMQKEFGKVEPNFSIEIESMDVPNIRIPGGYVSRLLHAIHAAPHGVENMSTDVPGLTETSTNMARVHASNGEVEILFLTRSSSDSRKMLLARKIESAFRLMDAETIEHSGAYPGWIPNPDSEILQVMKKGYETQFGKTPKVMAIHAGLECGILGRNYPNMDMISFGPTIRNPHSPDEMVLISTVQKFWDYLLETLKNIPEK
jgi:dipeptidase D